MGKLLEFKPELIDNPDNPVIHGEARCLACSHIWIATASVGTVFLECPSCHLIKGAFAYFCDRTKDGLHWKCNCGNFLFLIVDEHIYCPNCGVQQYFD